MEITHELTKKEDIDLTDKFILDACCGSRMMWCNREHPNALYQDIREVEDTLCDGRLLKVKPDVFASYLNMPYDDGTFYMVVWDPPHLFNLGENSWMCKKYGKLDKNTWRNELSKGFSECMRVLKDKGTLIVKFSTRNIPAKDFYETVGKKPLFGTVIGRNSDTLWMAYMKGVD